MATKALESTRVGSAVAAQCVHPKRHLCGYDLKLNRYTSLLALCCKTSFHSSTSGRSRISSTESHDFSTSTAAECVIFVKSQPFTYKSKQNTISKSVKESNDTAT